MRVWLGTEEIGRALAEHFAGGILFDMRFHADDDFVHSDLRL
jgi:hypothetical protein